MRLRNPVGNLPDRVGEISPRTGQLECRGDEVDLVIRERNRQPTEKGNAQQNADGESSHGDHRRGPPAGRKRPEHGSGEPGTAPQQEQRGRRASGRGRRGDQEKPEEQSRKSPGGIGVEEKRRTNRSKEIDRDDERRRETDDDGSPRVPVVLQGV